MGPAFFNATYNRLFARSWQFPRRPVSHLIQIKQVKNRSKSEDQSKSKAGLGRSNPNPSPGRPEPIQIQSLLHFLERIQSNPTKIQSKSKARALNAIQIQGCEIKSKGRACLRPSDRGTCTLTWLSWHNLERGLEKRSE